MAWNGSTIRVAWGAVTVSVALAGLGLTSCNGTIGELAEEGPGTSFQGALVAATGSMAYHRSNFPAVALQSGRVLVVGGNSSDLPYSSHRAELYDPAAGSFQATGSLSVGRAGHAAALLPNGRVLVSGGNPQGGGTSITDEIYDPAAGTWLVVGSDLSRRDLASATLADGKILLAGGAGAYPTIYGTARVFDPANASFTAVGSMVTPRYGATATLLDNGKVLVVGGVDSTAYNSSVAELFDPATGTWTATASMHVPRSIHTATKLPDGRVLVIGGVNSIIEASTELYDPATQTWSWSASLASARYDHRAALLSDGSVLVLGGQTSTTALLANAERWVLGTGFAAAPSLESPRRGFGLAPLSGGRWLVAGGVDAIGYSQSAAVYSLTCTPSSCTPGACGTVPDGCGGTLSCGACGDGLTCSASNVCVAAAASATHDPTLKVPLCGAVASGCDSASLLVGRAALGPEANAPNTIRAACADGTSGTFHMDESLDRLRVVTPNGGALAAGSPARVEATVWAYAGYSSDKLDLYVTGDALATTPTWTYLATLTPAGAGTQTLSSTFTVPSGGSVKAVRGVFRFGGSAGSCPGGGYTDVDDLAFIASAPTDLQPPSISITSPVSGTMAHGTVSIGVSASDDTAVVAVQCFDAAVQIGASTVPPFTMAWDTRTAANGQHTLSCSAQDAVGHSTTSAPVTLTVANDAQAPSVSITSPVEGATTLPWQTVDVLATDDIGVVRVDYFLDGAKLFTAGPPAFGFSWHTDVFPNGQHTLTALAVDAAGNTTTSAPVTVTVAHDGTPPETTLTSPVAGATLSGVVTLTAAATDDSSGIFRVDFWDETNLVGSTSTAPYTVSWNTKQVANGTHTLFTRAYDKCNNLGTSATVTLTVNNDLTPPTISLSSPASGQILSGVTTLAATASDNVGVVRVEFWDGSILLATDTAAPWSYGWDTALAPNGGHSVSARAYDAAGNVGSSPSVSVTISNGSNQNVAAYDATLKAPACAITGAACDSGSLLTGRALVGPEANAPNTLGSMCADGAAGAFHSDESLDQLRIATVDGTSLSAGKVVRVEATVWAYSSYTADKLDLYYASNAASPSWTFLTTITPTGAGAQVLSATYTLPEGAQQAVRGVFRYSGSAGSCTTGFFDDHDDLVFRTQ